MCYHRGVRIVIASIVIAAFGCGERKQQEPADLKPMVTSPIPEVAVELAPLPSSANIVAVSASSERIYVKADVNEREPSHIYLAADPTVTVEQLFKTLDGLIRSGHRDFSLVIRTPKGIGALPLQLPRAIAGDVDSDPMLLLSIARGDNGEPRLFLGARSIEMNELATALRESSRKRVALDVDRATTVGTFAKVLAAATTAQLDVMLMTKPVVHEAPEPVRRESAIQSKP